MTSVFRSAALGTTLLAGAWVAAPAEAADSGGQAVAQCRAEMQRHFPDGAIRGYRVGEIAGTSRRTRVTLFVTADRRYRFECATDADGAIVTATLDPPRADRQLASGE